jgi:hypothetical protein
MMMGIVVVAALLVTTPSAETEAPSSAPIGLASPQDEAVVLATGSRVHLTLLEPPELGGGVLDGTLRIPSHGPWTLETSIDSVVFNPAAVQRLSVRRSWLGTGAIVGSVAGILMGGFFGMYLGFMGNPGNPEVKKPMVIGALTGGVLLGLAGGGIGYAIPDWQQVYPRTD